MTRADQELVRVVVHHSARHAARQIALRHTAERRVDRTGRDRRDGGVEAQLSAGGHDLKLHFRKRPVEAQR